jgi:hypothetical protein
VTSQIAVLALSIVLIAGFSTHALAQEKDDAYLAYLKNAPEFKPVSHDPSFLVGRWDTWVYMPWRYQWTIGTGDAGGEFCKEYGFNGGFSDHGEGPLAWLDKWHLKFYNDHTAAKGYLHLRGAQEEANFKKYFNDPRAIRSGTDGPVPIDEALYKKLDGIITERVNKLKVSPYRIAYALDDETSWGAFVLPIPWRLNDDDKAYEKWLGSYYGGDAPKAQYVTPDFTQAQLDRPLGEIDFSPLLDRLTYNDSVWANFLGRLVSRANEVDPTTPCGIVGAQAPSIWGGYDYAKLAKKLQFIEAYDLGSSQAIIRSLSPDNAMPVVTTHFHSEKAGTSADRWQAWYYFAHGNRGIIGWVQGWFEGGKPKSWIKEFSPTLKELGGVQGPKVAGAKWIHDGVAIYYSHPSIQVSYLLDIEPHGKTWVNRRGDYSRGTSHTVRKAWEYMLADAGLQYNFVAYDEVARNGVPAEYKVLILPACYAFSDIEAKRIREFAEGGGTVIADFGCGLFDQHGKGRAAGALDDLFGVRHTGALTKKDLFGGKIWTEADQDKAYDFKDYGQLLDTVKCTMNDGYAVAETSLGAGGAKTTGATGIVRKVGKGQAIYLNLSPLRYLQYRGEGRADDARRAPFVTHVLSSGVKPWIKLMGPDGKRPRNAEATYWSKNGRTWVFVVQNVPMTGDEEGGGQRTGPAVAKTRIDIEFAGSVKGMVNERTGAKLGDGRKFTADFDASEAAFVSFEGAPPHK